MKRHQVRCMRYSFYLFIIAALIIGVAEPANYMYEKPSIMHVETVLGSYGFSGAKLIESKIGSSLSSDNTLGVEMESGTWCKVISSKESLNNTEKIGDYKSLEPLFCALNNSDGKVQKNAAEVLEYLGWNISAEENEAEAKQFASAASSHQAEKMLDEGRALASQGNLEEAVQAFDEVLKLDSENLSAWYLKATILAWQGKSQEAYECYDKVATVKGEGIVGSFIFGGPVLLQLDQTQPRKSGIFNSYIDGSVLDPYGRLPILDSTIGTLVLCGGAPKTEGSSRIKVCSSGCAYTDFKSAIDAAMPGETIDVAEGTYFEDINITKSLWFRSAGEGVRYEGTISSNGFPVTFEGESANSFAAVNLYPKGVQDEILGLKDPDSDVRFVSLMVLARENDSRAIEPITPLLYDENEHLRVAAAEALLKMGVRKQSAKDVALYLMGEKEAAQQNLDEAVKRDSVDADAWFSKGFVQELEKNYSESIECYEKATGLNQSFVVAWVKKGSLHKELTQYDDALRCYEKALSLCQSDARIWHETGAILLECDNLSGAWDCYNRALHMGWKDTSLWSDEWKDKGDSFCISGNYSRAVECYNASIRLNSQDPAIWNAKGCALAAQEMVTEATECFLHSTALDPMYSPPRYNNGVLLKHIGQIDEALKCFDEAARLAPAYPDIWEARGEALQALGRSSEAEANCAAAKKLNKESGYVGQSVTEIKSSSGNVITETTELEAERQSSINASQSTPVYDDPQIYDIIATWKSLLGNESNGSSGKRAAKSSPHESINLRCICNASGDQSDPVVGGNDQVGYYVAWMDNRTGRPDIYVYSLAQEKELPFAVGPYEDMYPDIDGSVISWESHNPRNKYYIEDYWSIWALDMSNANVTELVHGLEDATDISIRGNYLTYVQLPVPAFGARIYKKPLCGDETTPAIPPAGSNPRSGGDFVVYQSDKNDSWDTYIWKRDGSPMPLQTDGYDQINPATDGHTVVWQDNRSGNWDIYAFDLNSSQEIQITKDLADQTHPDVESGVVVWQDDRNGNWDLYLYDQKAQTERVICTDAGNQTQPRIRMGRIVWTDDRNGGQDIYLCESLAI
ncbi:MAG: tetratricopeptide repeat protein [Methanothrix sp.]|nr:tetratricopeptide repeat protein [Methanothrix sp.]